MNALSNGFAFSSSAMSASDISAPISIGSWPASPSGSPKMRSYAASSSASSAS